MTKIGKYIALFLNCIAIILLLCAAISPKIDPNKIGIISSVGLIMPYIIILNIVFIIYWMIKASFHFMWSIVAMALTWSTVHTSLSYNRAKDVSDEGITVMSYNVRLFDRYNWSKDKNTVQKMLTFIKDEQADIICFQEFGTSKTGITEKYILNAIGRYPYKYIHYAPTKRKDKYGMAILSKYPLYNFGLKGDPTLLKGCIIYADVKIGGEKFKIINAHFESLHISNKYNIAEGIDKENYKSRIKNAVRSFNKASDTHANFAEQVTHVISASKHPNILCVDMNNSPVSYAYKTITEDMSDAYLYEGIGFGGTYNGNYPLLRIDYIFYDQELPIVAYKRNKVKHSDHYPITATFAIDAE